MSVMFGFKLKNREEVPNKQKFLIALLANNLNKILSSDLRDKLEENPCLDKLFERVAQSILIKTPLKDSYTYFLQKSIAADKYFDCVMEFLKETKWEEEVNEILFNMKNVYDIFPEEMEDSELFNPVLASGFGFFNGYCLKNEDNIEQKLKQDLFVLCWKSLLEFAKRVEPNLSEELYTLEVKLEEFDNKIIELNLR